MGDESQTVLYDDSGPPGASDELSVAAVPSQSVAPQLAALSWCIGEIRQSLADTQAELEALTPAGVEAAAGDPAARANAGSGGNPVVAPDWDKGHLAAARMALHQTCGALAVVELPGATVLACEAENLLDAIERGTVAPSPDVIARIVNALSALTEYLEDLLRGVPDQPLYLYSAYRALLEARGAERIHPADLFFPPLTARLDVAGPPTTTLDAGTLAGVRATFEAGLLKLLRNSESREGLVQLYQAIAAFETSDIARHSGSFWVVVLAYFEALRDGALVLDVLGKRLIARVNLQLRRTIGQQAPVAERLLRDTLFALAGSRGGSERVARVREAFELAGSVPDDFDTPRYGAIDRTAWAGARSALSRATAAWDRAARGQERELPNFLAAIEDFAQAVSCLGVSGLEQLARAWLAAGRGVQAAASPVPDGLGIEVAMALLFAEEALESGLRQRESTDARGMEMADRIAKIVAGNASTPIPVWLHELAAAAQERSTMGAFVGEVSANLRGVEKVLDAFFRDHERRAGLHAALDELKQVAGALRLLGCADAASATDAITARVAAFELATQSPDPAECDALALDVGALGFFIEDLRNPGREAATYHFDAKSGRFSARLVEKLHALALQAEMPVGWSPDAADFGAAFSGDDGAAAEAARGIAGSAAASREDVTGRLAGSAEQRVAALRRELADALSQRARAPEDLAALAEVVTRLHQGRDGAQIADDDNARKRFDEAITLLETDPTMPAERIARVLGIGIAADVGRIALGAQPATLGVEAGPEAIGLAMDRELVQVFLEEAREVLDAIECDAAALSDAMADQDLLAKIRRAFHTLKGSSRMVGLQILGETAWAVEQVMNLWLAEARNGSADLLRLVARARAVLRGWLEAIGQGLQWGEEAADLMAACAALRDTGRLPVDFAAARRASLPAPTAVDAANEESGEAPSAPVFDDEDAAGFETIDILPPASEIDQQRSLLELGGAEFLELNASTLLVPPFPDLRLGVETDWGPTPLPQREIEIGGRRIRETLYTTFLAESDAVLAELVADADEWHLSPLRPASEAAQRCMHTLKGSADVVGLDDAHVIAGHIEDFLLGQQARAVPTGPEDRADYSLLIERLQAMLHQFAAGTMPVEEPETRLLARTLAQRWPIGAPVARSAAIVAALEPAACVDEFDSDLLPIFVEEAQDWLPQVGEHLRDWLARPQDRSLSQWLMRALHTVKGSARMAGAMVLGQRVHELEAGVELAAVSDEVPAAAIEELIARHDEVMSLFEAMRAPAARTPETVGTVETTPGVPDLRDETMVAATDAPIAFEPEEIGADSVPEAAAQPDDDFVVSEVAAVPIVSQAVLVPASDPASRHSAAQPQQQMVRVRADVLDDLVNQAGEVSIARSRIDNSMGTLRQSLGELADNVARLRSQLREVEIQAETQIQARLAQQRESQGEFDPLEFDRFTRLQELTRMLAESVNDVATVQHGAFRSLDDASQDLLRQGRVLRELQHDLMQVRMVPFGSAADRMYRVVRQTAKQLGKRVSLDIRGSGVELDRGVLERMAAPIEHLLRNAVAHGVETPELRVAAGKPETGEITIEVRQEGNEVMLLFADDGAGLDFERIRARALATGLVREGQAFTDATLAALILMPGFSTVTEIDQISGRGVGLDVVHEEVSALGGRIAIDAGRGTGTRFTIHLPLTMAIAQVVIVGVGQLKYAVASTNFEQVLQLRPQALAQAYEQGAIDWLDARVPLYYLGTLVGAPDLTPVAQHYSQVVVLHSAGQRIAVHVDTVSRNQEVVVKNVGRQIARVRGVSGATVLGNGEIVLILNPGQLAKQLARGGLVAARVPVAAPALAAAPPTVMVVDDSLTVRKATQRLLSREGFEVLLAKDGLDALRLIQDQVPDVILVDIEMPRMDGFDLTRSLRSDARTRDLPILMISSRTADKHKSRAAELGVDVFLGKPYRDEELLGHIRRMIANAGERRTAS